MRVFRVDYPEIVDQLIELFVESTPPLLGELREGAEGGDGEAVRRAAHKLKGSCQNIGAGFMAKLAADIERGRAAAPAAARRRSTASSRTRATRCAPRCWRTTPDVTLVLLVAGRRRGRHGRARAPRAPRRALASERRYRALAAQWPDARDRADRPRPALRAARGRGARAPWLDARRGASARPSPRSSPPSAATAEALPIDGRARGRAGLARVAGVALERDVSGRRAAVRASTGEITHVDARRCATSARSARCSARSRSSAASSRPCSTQLGERVRVADADGRLLALRRLDRRHDGPAPARVGRALRPAPPRRPPVRPARDAAAARAARRARSRDVEVRVETADGALALLASGGPVHGAGRAQARRRRRQRRPDRLPRRRGAPAPQRGAPPPRRRERQRLRVRDRRAGALDAPHRGLDRAPPGFTRRGLARPPVVGVRAPRRPRRARARVRAADGRRARRAAPLAPLPHRRRRRALGRGPGARDQRLGRAPDRLRRASCATSPTSGARSSTPPPSRPSCAALDADGGLEDAGAGAARGLGRELGWDGAELWRMGDDERLRRTAHVDGARRPARSLHRVPATGSPTRSATASRAGVDVARAAVEVRHHATISSCGARTALADGIRSAVALPLRADGRAGRRRRPGLAHAARAGAGPRAAAGGDRRPRHPVPAAPRGRGPRRRAGRGPAQAVGDRARARRARTTCSARA